MDFDDDSSEVSDEHFTHMYVGSIVRDSVLPSTFIDHVEDALLRHRNSKMAFSESLPLEDDTEEHKHNIEADSDIIVKTEDTESTEAQQLSLLAPAIDLIARLKEKNEELTVLSPTHFETMQMHTRTVQLRGTHLNGTCVRALSKAQPAQPGLEMIDLSGNSKIGEYLGQLFDALVSPDCEALSVLHCCAVASTTADMSVCVEKKLQSEFLNEVYESMSRRPLQIDIRGCGVPRDVHVHILSIVEKCAWLYVITDGKDSSSHPAHKLNKLLYQRTMNSFGGVHALHSFPIEGCPCVSNLQSAEDDHMSQKACLCTLVSCPTGSPFHQALLNTVKTQHSCVCLAAHETKVAGFVFVNDKVGIAFPPLSSIYTQTYCTQVQNMRREHVLAVTCGKNTSLQSKLTSYLDCISQTLKNVQPDLKELSTQSTTLHIEWQHLCASLCTQTEQLSVGSDSTTIQILYQTLNAVLPILYLRISNTHTLYGQASSISPLHARFCAVNMVYATELAACQQQLTVVANTADTLRCVLTSHLQQLTLLATAWLNTEHTHECSSNNNSTAESDHSIYKDSPILDNNGHLLSLASFALQTKSCTCRAQDLAPVHKTTLLILDMEFSRAHLCGIWLDQVLAPGSALSTLPCPPTVILDGLHSFIHSVHLLVTSRTVAMPLRQLLSCCAPIAEIQSSPARKYAQNVAVNLLVCRFSIGLSGDSPAPLLMPLVQGVAALTQAVCDALYLPGLDASGSSSPEAQSLASFLASPPRSRSGSVTAPAPSTPTLCASLLACTHSLTRVGNSLAAITSAIPFIPIFSSFAHALILDAALVLPLSLPAALVADPNLLDLAQSKRVILPLPNVQIVMCFFDQAVKYSMHVSEFLTGAIPITPLATALLKCLYSSNMELPLFPAYTPFTSATALKTVMLALKDADTAAYQVSNVVEPYAVPILDSASLFSSRPIKTEPTSLSFFRTGSLYDTMTSTLPAASLLPSSSSGDAVLAVANGAVPISPLTALFQLNSYATLLPPQQTSGSCLARLRVQSATGETELVLHIICKIFADRSYGVMIKSLTSVLQSPASALTVQTHYPDCQQLLASWLDNVAHATTYQSQQQKTAMKLRIQGCKKYTVSPAVLCHAYQLTRAALQYVFQYKLPLKVGLAVADESLHPDLFQHVLGHQNGLIGSCSVLFSQLSNFCKPVTEAPTSLALASATPLAQKPSLEDVNTLLHALPADISLSDEETDGIEWNLQLNLDSQYSGLPLAMHSPLLQPSPRLTSFSPSSLEMVNGSAFSKIVGSKMEDSQVPLSPLFTLNTTHSPHISALDASLDCLDSVCSEEPVSLALLQHTNVSTYISTSFLDSLLAAAINTNTIDQHTALGLLSAVSKLGSRVCDCKRKCTCTLSLPAVHTLISALRHGSLCAKTSPLGAPLQSPFSVLASHLLLVVPYIEQQVKTLALLLVSDAARVFVRCMEPTPSLMWLDNNADNSGYSSDLLDLVDRTLMHCLAHLSSKHSVPTSVACVCAAADAWTLDQTVMHTVLAFTSKTHRFSSYIASHCCNCAIPRPVPAVSIHSAALFLPSYLQSIARNAIFDSTEIAVGLAYILRITEIPAQPSGSWFSRKKPTRVETTEQPSNKVLHRLREEAAAFDSYFSSVRVAGDFPHTGHSAHLLRQSAALIEAGLGALAAKSNIDLIDRIYALLTPFFQDLIDRGYTDSLPSSTCPTLLLQFIDRLLRIAQIVREDRQTQLERLAVHHQLGNMVGLKDISNITREAMTVIKFK